MIKLSFPKFMPYDKWLHLQAGLMIYAAAGFTWLNVWLAFWIVFALALIKEILDLIFDMRNTPFKPWRWVKRPKLAKPTVNHLLDFVATIALPLALTIAIPLIFG